MSNRLKRIDAAIRKWLCAKLGHKFYVGESGWYPGLGQSHCWRCGKCGPSWGDGYKQQHQIEPIGNWFD